LRIASNTFLRVGSGIRVSTPRYALVPKA
jgi:hypothetical protein